MSTKTKKIETNNGDENKVSHSWDAKTRKVTATFTFRRNKDAPQQTKACVFDFGSVNEEELIGLAMVCGSSEDAGDTA